MGHGTQQKSLICVKADQLDSLQTKRIAAN